MSCIHFTLPYFNYGSTQLPLELGYAAQITSNNLWRCGRLCTGYTWWRHQMETFSALQAICEGNSPVTGEFPAQRPVTRGFDISLIWPRINGWVNNHEADDLRREYSPPLWRHSNESSLVELDYVIRMGGKPCHFPVITTVVECCHFAFTTTKVSLTHWARVTQWTWASLDQIMVCHLLGAKLQFEPMMEYC